MKNNVFVIDLGKSEIMGKSKSAEIPTEAEIDSFLVGSCHMCGVVTGLVLVQQQIVLGSS